MKLLVVEDEAVVARRLIRLLRESLGDRLERLEHAADLETARRLLADEAKSRTPEDDATFDAVFLDLDVGGRDGFDLLAEASAERCRVIVVSAHSERALEAFEHAVLDFVPKPFDRERLERALERVPSARGDAGLEVLAVRKAGQVVLVPVERVVSVHGAGDYAELRCDDGGRHLHAKTLDALERELPERFVRIHRSVLADLERAEALESLPGSRYFLRMRGGERLAVGRSRVAALRSRWG